MVRYSLILLLLTLTGSAIAQGFNPESLRKVNTLTEIKKFRGIHNEYAYMTGRDSVGDGLGGVFRYDTSSLSTADDMNFMQVTGVTKGRWIRVNQNTITYPQGTMFKIGPLKLFAGTAVTAGGAGEATVNLTTDNTASGPALFTSVSFYGASCENSVGTSVDNPYTTYRTPANIKQVTFRATRGATLAVLGATVIGVPNGSTIRYIVIGL